MAALGLLPVDFLAARLDDVQVEVGLGVPEEGELGIADLDLDASNVFAPLAEPGQAEAVAVARAGVVVVQAACRRSACRRRRVGLNRASSGLEVGRNERREQRRRRLDLGQGHRQLGVQAATQGQAILDPIFRTGQAAVESPGTGLVEVQSTRTPAREVTPRAGPAR